MIDNCSVLARGLYADWPARAGLPRDALRLGLHVRDHSGWRLDKVDHGAAQPLPYGRAAGRALTHARRSCRPRWHRDERGVDDGRPWSTSRGLPLRLEGLPLRIRLFSKRLKFRQNLRCARQFSEIGSQQRARGGGARSRTGSARAGARGFFAPAGSARAGARGFFAPASGRSHVVWPMAFT